jgi:hypothetical protein
MNNNMIQNLTPEEITKKGEEIYFNELKDKLEKNHIGEYLVLEVESKKEFVNPSLIIALKRAKQNFPQKLFYIVQIGSIHKPITNYNKANYAWLF